MISEIIQKKINDLNLILLFSAAKLTLSKEEQFNAFQNQPKKNLKIYLTTNKCPIIAENCNFCVIFVIFSPNFTLYIW